MCEPNSPRFQRCQVYDWPPFFNKKYMNGPIFLDSYVKDPIFLTSSYMYIFFAQRFFEAAYPLGITRIDSDICVITSKKWVQKIKGQYMNRSTFWMIKYMNGSVISKARYMNGVGFGILARTPVPKFTPPPPPHEIWYVDHKYCYTNKCLLIDILSTKYLFQLAIIIYVSLYLEHDDIFWPHLQI